MYKNFKNTSKLVEFFKYKYKALKSISHKSLSTTNILSKYRKQTLLETPKNMSQNTSSVFGKPSS